MTGTTRSGTIRRPAPTPLLGKRQFRSKGALLNILLLTVGPAVLLAPVHGWALVTVVLVAWTLCMLVLRPEPGVWGNSLALALVLTLFQLNLPNLGSMTRIAGAIAVAAALAPFVLMPLRRMSGFPLVHLYGVVTAAYVLVGVLVSHETKMLNISITESIRRSGLFWLAIFLVCVQIPSLITLGARRRPRTPRRDPGIDPRPSGDYARRALLLVVVGYPLYYAPTYLGVGANLGEIPTLLHVFPVVGILLIWDQWLRGRLGPTWLVVCLGAAGFELVTGFGRGALYQGVEISVGMLAVYVVERRRMPWLALALVVAAALTLNVSKQDLRDPTGGRTHISGSNQLSRGVSFVVGVVEGAQHYTLDEFSKSAARFSFGGGDLLGTTMNIVPKEVPYWDARTYRFVPLAVFPRVLAPWKPTANYGQQFGHYLRLIGPEDEQTSVNFSLPTDAYVNFGIPGLIIIGLLIGAVLRFLTGWLKTSTSTRVVAGAVIASSILRGVESDSTTAFGLLIPLLLLLRLIEVWLVRADAPARPMSRKKRRRVNLALSR